MTLEPRGYNAIFQENNITDMQAKMLSITGNKARKAYDKFMAKQVSKPRARYVKAMLKAKGA
jgi:hypothetical protein